VDGRVFSVKEIRVFLFMKGVRKKICHFNKKKKEIFFPNKAIEKIISKTNQLLDDLNK